jgi:hypothetical protein
LLFSFASPRKLPKPKNVEGRVVVVDIAFASEAGGGFDKVTKPFIEGLGKRLVAWVDHHDSVDHKRYAADPRFVLTTKAEHGACPELVTPELVARFGAVDTIVCHTDFDGLVSAAKWDRGGVEPYPGADDDARAIDTRIGVPSATAERFDRAIRARPRDLNLMAIMVQHLASGLADASKWRPIDDAARELLVMEAETRRVAARYVRLAPGVAAVDCTNRNEPIDKTLLLLMGQQIEQVSVVIDHDTITLAAPFDSGLNFLTMLGLSGGMPTRASVPIAQLDDVWRALGLDPRAASAALDR